MVDSRILSLKQMDVIALHDSTANALVRLSQDHAFRNFTVREQSLLANAIPIERHSEPVQRGLP